VEKFAKDHSTAVPGNAKYTLGLGSKFEFDGAGAHESCAQGHVRTTDMQTTPFESGFKPPPLRHYCFLGQKWEGFHPRLLAAAWRRAGDGHSHLPATPTLTRGKLALGLSSNPNIVIRRSAQSKALIVHSLVPKINPQRKQKRRVRALQVLGLDAPDQGPPGSVPTQIPP